MARSISIAFAFLSFSRRSHRLNSKVAKIIILYLIGYKIDEINAISFQGDI